MKRTLLFLSAVPAALAVLAALPTVELADSRASEAPGGGPADPGRSPARGDVPENVRAALTSYCVNCHGARGKGGVSLTSLESPDLGERLDLLNKVQDQLFFRMMPPPDSDQPDEAARAALGGWVRAELRRHNASKLDERLPYPSAGNYVDHDLLFNGTIKDKAYTPARRWLVSPQIFHERVRDSLGLEGRSRNAPLGVLSPFTLPERSGVRDYDLTQLDGSHFVVMQNNAAWLASRVVGSLRVKLGEPISAIIENPKDRFLPPVSVQGKGKATIPTMPAFEAIVAKKTSPTDDELAAAVAFQFDRVLQRPPTDAEKARYLKLTRAAVEVGGNAAGLQKMLEAVWLESEFVYRLEFGAGEPDEYGRRMLSPREAAYAIAYVLGDKAPDAGLVSAARDGRLNTKADYEREVRRLLADTTQFAGVIDPSLTDARGNGAGANPLTVSTHPKLVRFFRDFFGYPMALRVFKDIERSDGYYHNPDRGSSQTPGHLVREADMVVNRILQEDRRVFESLLTTDKFFVAPVEDASAKMDALKEVRERFKGTEWYLVKPTDKKPTPRLTDEELAFLRKRLHHTSADRDLSIAMTHVEHFLRKGLDPHPQWNYPFGIHMLTPWARSYNISPPDWAYPRQQPFAVADRKGILTHPAWLIAHSQNSATDPVRRGKWIREKLLAGAVPDVPITVDAVIPEHRDKTLRQRLDAATGRQACAKCHRHMNPLGVTFEIFDDFGRYRTVESLEHPDNVLAKAKTKYGADTYKTAPVVASGRLTGTGDPTLDGEVKDAFDLIDRLSRSERVRQSIIRHAFRFFLGRNEMPSDSQTLIDADRAYVDSGGSFKAVVVSLLTSDSFMYRK
jgi:cytochrome c553